MAKKVTLQDIADAAGVSKASVSMILNRRGIKNFNADTVEKVYRIAGELGYSSVKRQTFHQAKLHSPIIMIIIPSLFNPYYTKLVRGIEEAAMAHGFFTSIRTTYWDAEREKAYVQQAHDNGLAGIIFCMIPQNLDFIYEINRKMPIVAIGDKRAELKIATVDMNNFEAGRDVAAHLESLGHKELAFLSTTLGNKHTSRVRRCKGVQSYCSEHNMRLYIMAKGDVPNVNNYLNSEYMAGHEFVRQCLKEYPQTTAIVAVNDMVALGAYNALIESGIRVPEDVSICGFDNIFPSTLVGVGLTSVDSTLNDCGMAAFKLINEQINSYEDMGKFESFTHMEFRSHVVPRKTTAAPRKEAVLQLKDIDEPKIVRRKKQKAGKTQPNLEQ